MTFYILLNHVATLFISLNVLTTLSFDSEVISYLYGGGKDDVFFQVTGNQRTLALKPKIEGKLSNLLVVTKNRKYYFDLIYDKDRPHQFIEVRHGSINLNQKEILNKKNFEILEGKTSYLFVNKQKKPVIINGVKVTQKDYFSKGIPILYEGVRILN